MNNQIIAVIPCYNEEKRLNKEVYLKSLASLPQLTILFVNDGSKDDTLKTISNLKEQNPSQIKVLHLANNSGKANAVFLGMQEAMKHSQDYLGYLDADLAVSLEEFVHLKEIAVSENKQFVFGARWKRIGSTITRKISRHYTGRIFATIASNLLDLDVYDTQCGAKVFTKKTAEQVFASPFHVNWIFDVEIFFRLLKIFPKATFDQYCLEIPLKEWRDVEGSKVKLSHSLNIITDFLKLRKLYR